MYHLFCCRIAKIQHGLPTNTVWGRCFCSPFKNTCLEHSHPSVIYLMTSKNNRNTNSDFSSFLQDTSGRPRGEEAEKGKESPIWGKQFMLFWGPQKKNIIWSLQLVYGKRCRSQTSRSYKDIRISELFLNHLHSSSFFAFRICYSFMTCSSYTTCCKAREMSQDCDFCWETSFLCSISSKGSKGDGIYYTHCTKFNTIHSWGQALLVKILANGIVTQMSAVLWPGPRRTQQAAGRLHITKKKSRRAEEKVRGAVQYSGCHFPCCSALTNLTGFKLSQQISPHHQINIYPLNRWHQGTSHQPGRANRAASCIPKMVQREKSNRTAELTRMRRHTAGKREEKHHLVKLHLTSVQECTWSFSGCNLLGFPKSSCARSHRDMKNGSNA